ncbi:MAG TPA: phosphatase PAP2 family protein [Mycobacteriales bacterium]|nr:phosphatase PAP2 family protein [Mycobacteriales bacterium]
MHDAAAARPEVARAPLRRLLAPYALAVVLASVSGLVAVAVASAYGLPLRDPDGLAGPSYVRLPAVVALFLLADVVPRALWRRTGLRAVARERWSPQRLAVVAVGLGSFYVTYVSYRNLKGALPFARPEVLDRDLLALDEAMAFGNDPAALLHDLLGTGVAAHLLAAVYLLFLAFVPLSLAAALVWSRDLRTGAWYVTALCLNWLLGAATYYLVPSLGPVFVRPGAYAALPETGVSALQDSLLTARAEVLADPVGADAIAGIAGFASLHTSIVFSAALLAHLLGLRAAVRWAAWVFLALTVLATAYFGWHYLVDDVAGLAVGGLAVLLAGWATRQLATRSEPEPSPAAG